MNNVWGDKFIKMFYDCLPKYFNSGHSFESALNNFKQQWHIEQPSQSNVSKDVEKAAEPLCMPVGIASEWFSQMRKDSGLTLREVEKETGISNSYLSQLETGKISAPSYNTVARLKNLYDKKKYSTTHNEELKTFSEWQKQQDNSAIGFAEWFMSDDNSYNKKYYSDDDNNGKWYDEFSEGINRHYKTTKELYNIYLKSINTK